MPVPLQFQHKRLFGIEYDGGLGQLPGSQPLLDGGIDTSIGITHRDVTESELLAGIDENPNRNRSTSTQLCVGWKVGKPPSVKQDTDFTGISGVFVKRGDQLLEVTIGALDQSDRSRNRSIGSLHEL
jgi:hypothetical protein